MLQRATFDRLSKRPDLVPVTASWFRAERPDRYGRSGKGNAEDELGKYAGAEHAIPFGIVAFHDGVPCGFGAVKEDAIPPHSERQPWAGAGYVLGA